MTTTQKTSVGALALVAMIGVLALMYPFATHAATDDYLTSSEKHNLAQKEATVVERDIKYLKDSDKLALAETERAALKDELHTARRSHDHSWYVEDLDEDYHTAWDKVDDLKKTVIHDRKALEQSENTYRGTLFNYELPIPDMLPFVSSS